MSKFATNIPSQAGSYNEMEDAQGGVRPHWQPLLQRLEHIGSAAIDSRWQRAQRMIRENGVTYNDPGDPAGKSRPWVLDPVPLMIAPDEWEALSAGLIQRMDVLNRTLADLYGEQKLLQSRMLPSELLFANPAFLRPCCPIQPPAGQYLTLLAVDLARTMDGSWCVIKDLTQSPPGPGYALENRLVISRTFPTLYRDSQVERLAPFFAALRDTLSQLAPNQPDAPRIVLLTSGPLSPTYFEHAYLARYLGFPLVEGHDLTVRNNKVFLKTLAGLRKVDVILRRQDDTFCDPVELNSQSVLGVPGLVQAAAAGEVVVSNALGSGLAGTPALISFFPFLCRNLLGEEPKLDSVITWWCGQEKERKQVLAELDRYVIKRAFAGHRELPIFVDALSSEERESLVNRIQAHPERYIAQEKIPLSTSPCRHEGRFESRQTMLRAFVVATRDGFQVMPGGLVRTSAESKTPIVSMEQGGGSKDAWVLSRGTVIPFSLLPKESEARLPSSREDNLPSRVADNLLWLGRYVQRAEMQTRLIRTILRRLTEETLPDGTPELPELMRTLSVTMEHPPPTSPIHQPVAELERTQTYLYGIIYDDEASSSLRKSVDSIRRSGGMVRDRISIDAWRILDRMGSEFYTETPSSDATDMLDMLDRLHIPLAAFSGLSSESMTHGYGWRFMDIGFRMERAIMSAQLLSELLSHPASYETPVLDAVLEVANSVITYRTRYQSAPAPLPLLDLLITDPSNPRSLAYQVAAIVDHVTSFSLLKESQNLPEEKLAQTLQRHVERCDLKALAARDAQGLRSHLAEYLESFTEKVTKLSDMITQRYLAHVQPTFQVSTFISSERSHGEKKP